MVQLHTTLKGCVLACLLLLVYEQNLLAQPGCTPNAIPIPGLPTTYSNLNSCGGGNDLTSQNVNSCNRDPFYFNGEDWLYSFTPSETGMLGFQITLNDDYGAFGYFLLYETCPFSNSNGQCVGDKYYTNSKNFDVATNVEAGKTYYLLVEGGTGIPCFSFDMLATDCVAPRQVAGQVIDNDSVRISWTLPGAYVPPGGFEWKIVADTSTVDSPGLLSGNAQALQTVAAGLPNGRRFKAVVRTVCTSGYSAWRESSVFTTHSICPDNLGPITVISDFPAKLLHQTTCGQGDDLTYMNTSYCTAGGGVVNGIDGVYQFVATTTGPMAMVYTATEPFTNALLYEGCPFDYQNGVCLNTVRANVGSPEIVADVTAGKTYYIVVDYYDSNTCVQDFNLQITDCVSPTLINLVGAKTAQPTLYWTVPHNAFPPNGFEWKIVADTSGPDGPAVQSGVATGDFVVLSALPNGRYFHVYMRSLCNDGPGRWISSDVFASKSVCPNNMNLIAEVSSFPKDFTDQTTCGLGDKINRDFSPLCPNISSYEYDGQDAIYTISSPTDVLVSVMLESNAMEFSMSLFNSCPFDDNVLCNRYDESNGSGPIQIFVLAGPNSTYYLELDRNYADSCMQYDLHFSTCLLPGSVGVSNIYRDSALLVWAEPNAPVVPQVYEWKIVPADSSAQAQPLFSGSTLTPQVQLSGLPAHALLTAYVRMQCSPGEFSPWYPSAPFQTPFRCPDNLGALTPVSSLPFIDTGATLCGKGNDITCTNLNSCGVQSFCNYLYGEDVVYTYTPQATECVNVQFESPGSGNMYYAVFEDCPFEQVGCVRSGFTSNTFPLTLNAGHTYYFYLDQGDWLPCINYDFSLIRPPLCDSLSILDPGSRVYADSAVVFYITSSYNPCFLPQQYEWRLVAPGTGPDGTLIQSDTTPSTEAGIYGLTPNTAYDFYVRSWCNDNDRGPWSAVYSFSTWPSCPASLGPVEAIASLPFEVSSSTCGKGNFSLKTFCSGDAPFPGEDEVWVFNIAQSIPLHIYFESEVGGATVHLSAVCPLSASIQGGQDRWCKVFDPGVAGADSISLELWPYTTYYIVVDNQSANVCGNYTLRIDTLPNNCGAVTGLQIDQVGFDDVDVSWQKPAAFEYHTQQYEARVVLAGGDPELPALQWYVPSFLNAATLSGLSSGTNYECYLRAVCDMGNGVWDGPVAFSTLSCPIESQSNGVVVIQANEQVHYNETTCGKGDEFNQPAGVNACEAGPGEDVLYRFQVPDHQLPKLYNLHFRTGQTGAVFSLYQDCNDGGACITGTRSWGEGVYGTLIEHQPDQRYYLLVDHPEAGVCFEYDWELEPYDTLYNAVDNPAITYTLPVGDTCRPVANTACTYNPAFEPLPPCMSDSATLGWFSFIAPPSGNITISTAPADSFSVFDTQLALYEPFYWPPGVDSPVLLACDDNSGTACNGCSMLSYGGLSPGFSYRIAVSAGGRQSGKFCLRVEEDLNVINHNQVSFYQQPGVGGHDWVSIADGTGSVLAAVQPNGNALGNLSIQTLNLTNVPEIASGAFVVPRVFQISCDGPDCGGTFNPPVDLRLVFSDQDLARFNDSTGLNLSVADLRVFHYDGPQEDCDPLNNATLPVLLPTSQLKSFEMGPKSFSIELETNSFSEFFIGSKGVLSSAPVVNAAENWAIKVSPVPVQDVLHVSFELAEAGPVLLELLLPTGQVCLTQIFTGTAGSNALAVPVKDLPGGMYFLSLRQAGQWGVVKVVR